MSGGRDPSPLSLDEDDEEPPEPLEVFFLLLAPVGPLEPPASLADPLLLLLLGPLTGLPGTASLSLLLRLRFELEEGLASSVEEVEALALSPRSRELSLLEISKRFRVIFCSSCYKSPFITC